MFLRGVGGPDGVFEVYTRSTSCFIPTHTYTPYILCFEVRSTWSTKDEVSDNGRISYHTPLHVPGILGIAGGVTCEKSKAVVLLKVRDNRRRGMSSNINVYLEYRSLWPTTHNPGDKHSKKHQTQHRPQSIVRSFKHTWISCLVRQTMCSVRTKRGMQALQWLRAVFLLEIKRFDRAPPSFAT